jgi:D-lyxose ketol-isomerase
VKSSEINLYIAQAIDFFKANNFPLPSFANWTPNTWQSNFPELIEDEPPIRLLCNEYPHLTD